MEYKDYYGILGVKRNATKDEIKAGYRRMAFRYHPDRNPSNFLAENKLKEINEAYQVLSDPIKRAQHDRISRTHGRWKRTYSSNTTEGKDRQSTDNEGWKHDENGDRIHPFGGLGEKILGKFSTFFEIIFQGIGRAMAGSEFDDEMQTRGKGNINTHPPDPPNKPNEGYEVSITLSEAFHGTTRTIVSGERRLLVKIPPGAASGMKVKVRGSGKFRTDGNNQDIVLFITVLDDANYKRKGDNIYIKTKVNLYTAILGGEVSVSCLDRMFVLNIPAGTQPDQVFRLKGKGMPRLRLPHEFGDLYIQVVISLPEKLSENQRALFEILAQSV